MSDKVVPAVLAVSYSMLGVIFLETEIALQQHSLSQMRVMPYRLTNVARVFTPQFHHRFIKFPTVSSIFLNVSWKSQL